MTTIAHQMLQQPDVTLRGYNLWDCVATARVARAMQEELEDNRQREFWEKRWWPLVDPVLAMQERGLGLDMECRNKLQHDLKGQLLDLDGAIVRHDPTKEIAKPCGKSANGLNAPGRVGVFLFDALGLKSGKQTASGGRSVDQESLLRVLNGLRKMDEHARPVLYDLFHRSRLKTILQRYLTLTAEKDGRVRPNIKMAGTETGRFAYSKPALQQAPPEVRQMFIPREDHVFVSADYSQLEARISAYLIDDPQDIAIFEDPEGDIHTSTAHELFGLLEVSQFKAARDYAKTFRYGLMYGGKPETLKMKTYCPCPRCEAHLPPTLKLKPKEVTDASRRWLSNHPRLTTWRNEVLKVVMKDRSYENCFGRKRFYFGPKSSVQRECWNWPIQSTAADLINRAMVNGHYRYGLPFVLQMHDELMMEVPIGDVDARVAQLKEVMEEPVPELGGVSFPVDVDVEVRWGVGA